MCYFFEIRMTSEKCNPGVVSVVIVSWSIEANLRIPVCLTGSQSSVAISVFAASGTRGIVELTRAVLPHFRSDNNQLQNKPCGHSYFLRIIYDVDNCVGIRGNWPAIDPWWYERVSKSHGCRLEDCGNSWVDGWIITFKTNTRQMSSWVAS